jgi:hypothetical protein
MATISPHATFSDGLSPTRSSAGPRAGDRIRCKALTGVGSDERVLDRELSLLLIPAQ